MESILLFLAQPFFLLSYFVIHLKAFFSTGFLDLEDPATIDFLNYCKDCLLIYLKGYELMFTLRFVLIWFPNVNPFVAPAYIVRVVTQPFIGFIAKRLPHVFGLDLSFLVCSIILTFALYFLTHLKF
jgi:uncharacterized protein YggT (Ycf19 family)